MAARVVIFDLESTGLSRTDDRIVSVAAIDMQTKEEFYEEVNPLMKVSRGAAKVHGLTDEHLLAKPIWAVVGPRFWDWLLKRQEPGRDMHLFAHNGKSFDVVPKVYNFERLKLADWVWECNQNVVLAVHCPQAAEISHRGGQQVYAIV